MSLSARSRDRPIVRGVKRRNLEESLTASCLRFIERRSVLCGPIAVLRRPECLAGSGRLRGDRTEIWTYRRGRRTAKYPGPTLHHSQGREPPVEDVNARPHRRKRQHGFLLANVTLSVFSRTVWASKWLPRVSMRRRRRPSGNPTRQPVNCNRTVPSTVSRARWIRLTEKLQALSTGWRMFRDHADHRLISPSLTGALHRAWPPH